MTELRIEPYTSSTCPFVYRIPSCALSFGFRSQMLFLSFTLIPFECVQSRVSLAHQARPNGFDAVPYFVEQCTSYSC